MKKKLPILITILYFILCLIISFNRVPFWDEARAWLIAQNCNVFEFLDLMKLECHMFIWFAIIAPFAKLNLFYPYSIYILNTLFASLSIFLLWKKSPFSLFNKILITFSVPFLFLWGSVARCYSIGILFLFLALSFYKIRFKKPIIYLSYLCLAMNTSVMAFIGAFYLSIVFLLEFLKKKKNKLFLQLTLIFLFAIGIVAIQIYSPNPDYLKQAPEMGFLRDLLFYLFSPLIIIKDFPVQSFLMSLTRIVVILNLLSFVFYAFKTNKKILFLGLAINFSLIVLFSCFYSGNFWHYFYFYLYFIILIWILKIENKKISNFLNIAFSMILICFLFKGSLFYDSKMTIINNSKAIEIKNEIEQLKDYKIFCFDAWSDIAPSSLPYLKDIKIYDQYNQERKTYKSMRSQIKFNTTYFDADKFYEYCDNNSILITTGIFAKHEEKNPSLIKKENKMIFKGNKHLIILIPYKQNDKIPFQSYLIKKK